MPWLMIQVGASGRLSMWAMANNAPCAWCHGSAVRHPHGRAWAAEGDRGIIEWESPPDGLKRFRPKKVNSAKACACPSQPVPMRRPLDEPGPRSRPSSPHLSVPASSPSSGRLWDGDNRYRSNKVRKSAPGCGV